VNQKPDLRRLGFHYFQDTLHYTDRDLQTWLPLLEKIGVGWLILRSETSRAIPESFLSALVNKGIQPLIQFNLSLANSPEINNITDLIEAYTRWGVKYIQFFDRPNQRESWPAANWTQQDLVERFLDRFLPLAEVVVQAGCHPVFPALEPGGNFWDTAFLRAALQSMQRRKQTAIIEALVLAAYGWTYNRTLDWGAGGPERWPETRPYQTPPGSQNQRGFHIYDWYLATSLAVLQKPCPIIVLQAGLPNHPSRLQPEQIDSETLNNHALEIYNRITTQTNDSTIDDDINLPVNVLGCAFYVLAAEDDSEQSSLAWFNHQSALQPAAKIISKGFCLDSSTEILPGALNDNFLIKVVHPIQHYLLLNPEAQMDRYIPYIQEHRPTIGFSPDEALLAARVTLTGRDTPLTKVMSDRLTRTGVCIEVID
jgi:hypothetical protein